ncbi:MAG: hypothetical protein Q7T44_17125 [Parvibaculum sp.]|nr:hypothetical protein [Parvibaculum sp.]
MSNAIQAAFGGMQEASTKASEAADMVARSNLATAVVAPAPAPPPASASSSSNLADSPAVINDVGKGQTDDPLQGVTEFQQAARAYEASLKAVEMLHELQKTLVEALGWVLPENTKKVS